MSLTNFLLFSVEVEVEFDYDAELSDELTIRAGDLIREVRQMDGGWWEGSLKGRRGLFPDNFVKVGLGLTGKKVKIFRFICQYRRPFCEYGCKDG